MSKDLTGKIIQTLIWLNKNPSNNMLDKNELSIPIEEFVKGNLLFTPKGWRGFCNVGIESNWQIKKFADSLKDIVCILTGCTREQLEDIDFKNSKLSYEWNLNFNEVMKFNTAINNDKIIQLTYRELLQILGTNLLRNQLHENVWVNALFSKYYTKGEKQHPYNLSECKWIVTDVRFPNEAKAITDRKGIVIRVDKPNMFDAAIKSLNLHPSEIALDNYKFDYVIDNNSDISSLIEKVREILVKEKII